MKKLAVILALIMCLVGCSHSKTPVDRPHSLEVRYGESSIFAMTCGYEWNWKKGGKTAAAQVDFADPRTEGQKLSFLNAGQAQTMELNFAEEPDELTVELFSAADGYAEPQTVELSGMTLPVPAEEDSFVYFVTATWKQEKGEKNWGSCIYCFRFLPQGESVPVASVSYDTGDLELPEVLQMDASDFMGIEFTNHVEGNTKTCRNQKDKAAILDFLRDNLNTDLTPVSVGGMQTDYMLRLVTVTGSQLTLGYGDAYLLAGDTAYDVGRMDFEGLWTSMAAGSISEEAAASGKNYLDMTDAFPGDDWGTDFVYGYLRGLGETVEYDEMRWLEDAEAPDGYQLQKGWPDQSAAVSPDCEYWLLDEHRGPYCKVTADTLLQWSQDAETDVLYRIYTKDDVVIAICQQYIA